MEGELWNGLYSRVLAESSRQPRRPGVQYTEAVVVLVYFWAVLHDRPVSWACDRRNWGEHLLWERLPSSSTISRRMRSLPVQLLLERLLGSVQAGTCLCRRMDSKPLPIGGFSKDRNAKRGYATGGIARGYKLYCIWGRGIVPEVWRVDPLNRADVAIAWDLIERLDGGGYLLADATHEGNPLAEQAGRHGFQLVSPRTKPGTRLGHQAQSPWRLRSIELTEGPGLFGPSLYRNREGIEREYGQLTGFSCGLHPLPSWVRGPRRVAMWVAGKLLINAMRILHNRHALPNSIHAQQRVAA